VTTTPIPNSNLLAILPELQKSLQAMQQVQTVNVVIQGKGTIQTSGTLLPAFARQTRHKTSDTPAPSSTVKQERASKRKDSPYAA